MKLIDYMHIRGFTVTKMAEILECDRTYLSKILHGHAIPSRRLAYYIQAMTEGQVTAQSLLEDKGTSDKNKDQLQ